jgi:hypothetical protein
MDAVTSPFVVGDKVRFTREFPLWAGSGEMVLTVSEVSKYPDNAWPWLHLHKPDGTNTGAWLATPGRFKLVEAFPSTKAPEPTYDPVHKPKHYATLYPEPIEVIENWGLNFNRGNVVKYLARAGSKGSEIEDLKKALVYLEREISRVSIHTTSKD